MIFGRLRDGAGGVLEAAEREARGLGHDTLGDDDLLLGVLAAGRGVSSEALHALGVTLGAAREESERLFAAALLSVGISLEDVRAEAGEAFRMGLPAGRRVPLSPAAKAALARAREEMRALGDRHLGPEHVLLAVAGRPGGMAVRILAGLGVEAGAVRREVMARRGPG